MQQPPTSKKASRRFLLPGLILLISCIVIIVGYFILRIVLIQDGWSISSLFSKAESAGPIIEPEKVSNEEAEGIPGLLQEELKSRLIENEFECTDAEIGDSGLIRWVCFEETQDYLKEVYVFSRSLTTIDFIDANISQKGEPSDELAIEFLSYVATFPENINHHDAAMNWVKETLPTITEIREIKEADFGGIQYRLYGISAARSLELGTLP
jgi:hypothetical protein